ncbi:MAG: transglutaminase-like domain-containing protein [Clostridia bacterium]|nr:transglutaminase-like domain-containing protein [Clostridia bacterium]
MKARAATFVSIVFTELLPAALLTLGSMLCLMSAYKLPYELTPLLAYCLGFASVFTLFMHAPKYRFAFCAVVMAGLLGLALWLLPNIRAGAGYILSAIDMRFGVSIGSAMLEGQLVTLPMIISGYNLIWAFFCAVMTLYHCCCIGLLKAPMLCYVIALPLGVLAVLFLDSPPNETHLLLLLFMLLLLPLLQLYCQSGNPKIGYLAVFLSAVLLGYLLLMRPIAKAVDLSWLKSEQIEAWLNDKNSSVNELDSPDSRDISVGADSPSNQVVMEVTSSTTGMLYLRGYSMAHYTGRSFDPPSEDFAGGFDSLHLAAAAVQNTYGNTYQHTLTVSYSSPSTLIYTPYFSLLSGDVVMSESTVVMEDEVQSYYLDYTPPARIDLPSLTLPENLLDDELLYREYVYDTYTDDLPEIREIAEQIGILEASDRLSAIQLTIAYLTQNNQYSRTVDETPEGEDVVLYFLLQSHVGNCVHYSSSAVALLQSCGIPTRFVGGYMPQVMQENTATLVTEVDSHAWIEVYFDEIGWLPFEATFSSSIIQPTSSPNTDLVPSVEPHTPAPPDYVPTPTPALDEPVSPVTEDEEEDEDEPANIPWWLIGIAGAVALTVARRYLTKKLRARRFASMDNNAYAIAAYRFACKLNRQGLKLPPELVALANRARFSQHKLTAAERERVDYALRELALDVKTLPLPRVLVIRFIFAYD